MSIPPRPRGRPKGTGIDDRELLRAVNTLLSSDTALRPTTAIRRIGVTDPSVVRRLREKLKTIETLPTSPVEPEVARRNPLQRSKAPSKRPRTPLSPIPPAFQDTRREASQPVQPSISVASAPTATDDPAQSHAASPKANAAPEREPPAATPPPDPQLEAMRLAAEAAAAMSRLYLHCITFAAQTNPMSLALRSQTVMSQWIAGMLTAQMSATDQKSGD